MLLEDLQYIFKRQIDEGTEHLYFMIEDYEYKIVCRHDVNDMESMLPMLSCFRFAGNDGIMPRFVK